ncbi:MarR family winged helix-turn-helix transcriptional regulator [Streptomyces sp. NPDC002004]
MTDLPHGPHRDAPTPDPVDAELAGRLRAAIQHLMPVLRSHRAHPDLTPSRLAALAVLDERSPLRISELAERMGIALSTASRLVDLLVGHGWIERQPDPADQRASLVGLTAAGHTLLAAVRRDTGSRLAQEVAALPPDLRRQLRDALPALESLAARARASRLPAPRPAHRSPRR